MNATAKKQESEQMNFSADVARLLNIVANALYTNHDVFLRELISNSADACDRLRYEAIEKPDLTTDNANFRIHIYKDTDTRTLTVVDNGTGMGKAELIDDTERVIDILSAVATANQPLDDEAKQGMRTVLAKTAPKRIGIRVAPERVVSWDHRKLGGKY